MISVSATRLTLKQVSKDRAPAPHRHQHDLAGADREDGVHEEVVQAVHRVHAVQQPPCCRHWQRASG
ncbi:hypothetical protein [Streptomyces sp. NPDC003710]